MMSTHFSILNVTLTPDFPSRSEKPRGTTTGITTSPRRDGNELHVERGSASETTFKVQHPVCLKPFFPLKRHILCAALSSTPRFSECVCGQTGEEGVFFISV